jgi:hypothetical protein
VPNEGFFVVFLARAPCRKASLPDGKEKKEAFAL